MELNESLSSLFNRVKEVSMKYCRAILGGYLFCFFMTGSMAAAQETGQSLQGEFCCNPQLCVSQLCYRPCRFSLSGYVGEGMGHDTRRASAEFFYAPVPDNSLDWHPFIDLRAHYLSHDHWAANAGLGLRWIDACERIWGANVFYDFRESKGDFNQVGVGVETLGPCWDFRVNFYYPVGKKKHFSHLVVFDNFIGNFKMTCREAELAKRGAGAEFGLPICRRGCSEIYLAFGPYYYKYKHRENFWGGWRESSPATPSIWMSSLR